MTLMRDIRWRQVSGHWKYCNGTASTATPTQPGPDLRVVDAEERIPDVLLEPRRVRQRGDVADLPTVRVDVPVIRDPGPEGGAFDLDTDELALEALLLHPSERGLPEVVRPLVLVHGPAEAHLVRIVVEHDVRTVVQDSRLDPPDLGRGDRPDVVLGPRAHDRIPELLAEPRVAQI